MAAGFNIRRRKYERHTIKHLSLMQKIYKYCGLGVLCFLLILAFVNLYGRGPIFYFLFCFTAIALFLLKSIKPIAPINNLWPYILLTLGSCLAAVLYYDLSMLIKALCPILSFIIGYNIHRLSKDRWNTTRLVTYSILIGLLLIFGITYYFNYFVLGVKPGERLITDIWTMEIGQMPITGLSMYTSFMIGLSFYMILVAKSKIEIILGILLLGFVLYVNGIAASRSPFLILVLVYATLTIPYLKLSNKSAPYKKRLFVTSAFIVIGVLYLIFQIATDTNREESAIETRMEQDGLESSRTDLTIQYFSLMFEYPSGGGFAEKIVQKKAHNFIQECNDIFGIAAFISLIIICFSIATHTFRIFSFKRVLTIDFILLGIITSVLVQCLLEPIFSAYPQLMWCLFLYHGLLISYLHRQRINKVKKTIRYQRKTNVIRNSKTSLIS